MTFGLKSAEVTGDWRRRYNEELNDLYSLPKIVRVIKSRRVRWAGRVARVGARRGLYMVSVGHLGETVHLEDVGLGGRIILKLMFKILGGDMD
jgi:hypothetical protein